MDSRHDRLHADPEFAALLVPHTCEEEAILAESLRRQGCTDPLIVWKGHGCLLDGHARLRLCRTHGIPFEIVAVDLADREAARLWIWERQTGRRNLRPLAASYVRGVLYGSLRKNPGARTDLDRGVCERKWASREVAKRFGLDESTVRRDRRFSRDVDCVAADLGDVFRQDILTGQARLSRHSVVRLARMSRSEKERFLRARQEQRNHGRGTPRKPKVATRPDVHERPAGDAPAGTPSIPAPACTEVLASPKAGDEATNIGYLVIDDAAGDATARIASTAAVAEAVDEAIVRRLEELFHQANHATRLEFLGGPLVRAALRRLAATQTVSA